MVWVRNPGVSSGVSWFCYRARSGVRPQPGFQFPLTSQPSRTCTPNKNLQYTTPRAHGVTFIVATTYTDFGLEL
jgi:hypothetical protein